MMGTVGVSWTPDTNTNTGKFYKNNNTRIYSPIKETVHREYSPLRETPREYFECLEDSECHDELFLLPEQVLDMDSFAVREDLSAIVPSFRRSPHNSLDSEDSGSGSGKSLKLLEDSDGICLARASDDCRTFWLSESSSMAGVGELPPSMSQSMTGDLLTSPSQLATSPGPAPANIMSQSMMVPSSASAADNDLMTSSTNSLNMRSGKKYIPNRSRADLAAREREREERVRRLRESQDDDRRRKLEELKQHALQAQKFREQQEAERRRHIESLRSKDADRRLAVEERRREIEGKELERKEAIIARNRERETRVETQRRSSRGHLDFAFGSSAPRMMEPRVDSASGYWGSRSASGQQMFERSSASVDRETPETGGMRSKRTASAHGLNMTSEGDDGSQLSSGLTAHRRRTDLVPTIVMPRAVSGAPATPGSRHRSPGISRENSTASTARPGSAMSGGARAPASGVRLRSAGARRPRPMSIATTGMTSSMYEERQKPALVLRDKSLNTPKSERMKRARSVTSDTAAGDNEDTRSVSSAASGTRTPSRKTPSQVKAENAARKSKTSTPKLTSTPKSSLGNVSNGTREAGPKASSQSKTPSPAMSQDNIETASDSKRRQSTPDIIKDNNRKNVDSSDSKESSPCDNNEENNEGQESGEAKEQKRIITSEEEAKARIAEKRREMKEQKEKEAELERLRLEEEARQEAERLRQEEEEEKRIIALEAEARRAEEERIRKAIEEKEAEDRKKREEEERLREEKEEMERKVKAEAERREAELQEKLKKEEEERLARKKRIEEIMARTRGKGGATPKKEETEKDTAPASTSQPEPEQPRQPPSLDTNVDPTTPDLLGDIGDKVEENNARNLARNNGEPETVEKGALDSISSKSDENENSSPLISVEAGDSAPVKKLNGLVEGGSFDQILDLGDVADSNKALVPELPAPMMAFEESIQQQSQSAATADLLS